MAQGYWGGQETQCRCDSFGCRNDPQGYKTQTNKTKSRHLRRDQHMNATATAPPFAPLLPAVAPRSPTQLPPQPQPPLIADSPLQVPNDNLPNGSDDLPPMDFDFDMGIPSDSDSVDDDNENDLPPHPPSHSLGADPTRLLAQNQPDEDSDNEDAIQDSHLAPFLRELPAIRLLYLQTIIAYQEGQTVLQCNNQLRNGLDIIQEATGQPLPLKPAPATTLETVKRRLGLNVDEFIQERAICPECFRYYSQDNLEALDSPNCLTKKCKGVVYTEKRRRQPDSESDDSAEPPKRYPSKIHSYSPIIPSIQRMLLRPDFVNNLTDNSRFANPPPRDDDTPMSDIHDGDVYSQLEVGLKRIINEATGRPVDVEIVPGSRQRLVLCELGLNMTLNMDWFGIGKRVHSCGAIYICFNSLDRSVRYDPKNVILVMTIPGPQEPSLEQLNYILAPLVEELKRLNAGVQMRVFGKSKRTLVQAACTCQASDIPASRKFSGSAGHSHGTHPCNHCHATQADFNTTTGYDIDNFTLRSDNNQLIYAFQSKAIPTAAKRKKHLDRTGSRHSEMNELPGWFPIRCSPLDYMHNSLGIVSDYWQSSISTGYFLSAEQWRDFERTVNGAEWPSGIGRLPVNLATNHSLQKADQWRTLCNVQHILLWLAWRDPVDGTKIRKDTPSQPANTSKADFTRSIPDMYRLSLYLATAERTLGSRSITVNDARRGVKYLQQYCQLALSLGIPLKPNHHLAMHYVDMFKRFGPVYGWWLFAFERFNGYLEDVNLNGHAGGEMERTILRGWITKHRTYELLSSLPDCVTPKEHALLSRLSEKPGTARGTFRVQSAQFASGQSVLPASTGLRKPINLRTLRDGTYSLLLAYARKKWPDTVIVDDFTLLDPGAVAFVGHGSAFSLPFLVKDGIRFGSSNATRTRSDQFALVDFEEARLPCQIHYHFQIQVGNHSPILCSVVQRAVMDDHLPVMPWDLHADDLGTYLTYNNWWVSPEVVDASQLASAVCRFGDISIPGVQGHFSVYQSFDRTGIEPLEAWLQEE